MDTRTRAETDAILDAYNTITQSFYSGKMYGGGDGGGAATVAKKRGAAAAAAGTKPIACAFLGPAHRCPACARPAPGGESAGESAVSAKKTV